MARLLLSFCRFERRSSGPSRLRFIKLNDGINDRIMLRRYHAELQPKDSELCIDFRWETAGAEKRRDARKLSCLEQFYFSFEDELKILASPQVEMPKEGGHRNTG